MKEWEINSRVIRRITNVLSSREKCSCSLLPDDVGMKREKTYEIDMKDFYFLPNTVYAVERKIGTLFLK